MRALMLFSRLDWWQRTVLLVGMFGVPLSYPLAAYAQTAVAVTSTPISLVAILNTLINATVPVVIALFGYFLQSHMKNQQAAVVLSNAVKNSLGAIQNQATGVVTSLKPTISIPGLTPQMAAGVQYVADHAGAEMKQLGVTQDAIVEKIAAQIGLASIPNPPTAAVKPPLPSPAVAPGPLAPAINPTLPVVSMNPSVTAAPPTPPTTIITP